MNEIQQIRINKQDQYCFLIPKLGKDLQRKVTQLKKEYDIYIKLACFISYFSLKIVLYLSNFCFELPDYQKYFIPSILFQGLSCLVCGLFIDIISIKSTWSFTIISHVIFSLLSLLSVQNDNIQVFYFAKLSLFFLVPICIINLTCVLNEAATDYRDRLNNIVLLEAFGDYFVIIITYSVNFILKQQCNLQQDEIVQIQKNILTSGIILSILLNLISFVILNQTYKQIQKIKSQSIKYKRFLIYQGFGFSISKVFKYLDNKNIYYLLIIAALHGLQNTTLYYQKQKDDSVENISFLYILILSLATLTTVIFMRFVNSRKQLVSSTYKTASYCVYLYLISCVSQFIIYQYNTQISDTTFLIITTITSSINETIYFVQYCVMHQIMIILLPNSITMRGISLSITFFPFYLFKGFLGFMTRNLQQQRLIQMFMSILVVIVNFFYQRSISFDIIEQKLIKQYHFQ